MAPLECSVRQADGTNKILKQWGDHNSVMIKSIHHKLDLICQSLERHYKEAVCLWGNANGNYYRSAKSCLWRGYQYARLIYKMSDNGHLCVRFRNSLLKVSLEKLPLQLSTARGAVFKSPVCPTCSPEPNNMKLMLIWKEKSSTFSKLWSYNLHIWGCMFT